MSCNASCCNCCNTNSNTEDTYEDFVPYKEYHVGAFFKVGNEVFKVVVNNNYDYIDSCYFCDLEHDRYIRICEQSLCSKHDRLDGLPCSLILYDTLDETEDET